MPQPANSVNTANGLTPGPWIAQPSDPNRPDEFWEVFAPNAEGEGFGDWVAEFLSEPEARLFAAAPELLETVQRARRHAMNIGINSGSYVGLLDAAIAKATGHPQSPIKQAPEGVDPWLQSR